ncbi:hypothetical protein KUL118_38630 [Tenacibaculum sp. KUL118]|nr:hypothetical protein KUL118_38630 [Tenacibaculum sp. KUL118]
MSTYVFSLNDISVEDGSPVVSVNNSDSFFGLIEGSQLFIAGKLPATIIDHDTTTNTLTLKYNWQQGDLNNVAAQVVPIGAVGVLLQALENNRAAYAAFLENAGSGEVEWENINNPPQTSLRWPNFSELAGKISKEQLPDSVTQDKRLLAESPPVKQNPSLTHILSDYPTLKKTIDIPTHSPNNRRELLFDDARQVAYVALTEKWLRIPITIATRKFMVVKAGRYLRFNSAFTGDVTLTVYPMGNGGTGLPTNPNLADYQWHTVTINVTNLWTLGRDSGNYFEGIIDFVELTTASDNNWERLDSEKSKFTSLNAYFDNDYSTPRSPFDTFELRQDGYWYSQDITPDTPFSIGASWTQDNTDPRLYYANNVSDSNDGVRFFGDAYDNYEVELIVVAEIDRPLALTSSNESDLTVKFSGTERFICDSRLFLKRTNSALPVTGQIRIESIRIRVPDNG